MANFGATSTGSQIDLGERLEEWRRQLLDTSKRSRLVSCKFGRAGVLGIEHPGIDQVWETFGIQEAGAAFPWPSFLLGEDEEEVEVGTDAQLTDGVSDPTSSETADSTKPDRSWM